MTSTSPKTNSPATIREFYDLEAWQQGHEIVLGVYAMTKRFPAEERFGITSQLRRAASSITANIAEGFARYHYKDKVRFYIQARGSAAEVHNFLLLARDLKLINAMAFGQLVSKISVVSRLINGLIRANTQP